MTAIRPADLRRMIKELVERGATVTVLPDGTVQFKPAQQQSGDDFDNTPMSAR